MALFEKTETNSSINMTLIANPFDDSTYYGRVPRKTVDIDNIVSEISADYPSLDPYVIIHSAELLKEQILKFLKEGKAVNVLELGTIYLSAKGTIGKANPQVGDLPSLTLKFLPSKSVVASLECLSAESFMISDPAPQITRIVSLKDGSEEGVLHTGYPARLTGNKLKVAGTGSGIFLVPPGSDGSPDTDEDSWIAVDTSYLPRNTAKTLEFYLPQSATSGSSYFIAVRTAYISSAEQRKEAVTGFSADAVVVS